MNFNPLFLQNTTGADNIHPEKLNKLSGSGYLFSDIINVFMNTDENDSMTKLTQEFLGSAQIKESNGTPVILSLLGESSIPLADVTKNLQLKIEDLLPSGLKKKLIKVEGENNKNVSEKTLTANQNQLAQILETINNLFKIAQADSDSGTNNVILNTDETTDLLDNTDGVFLIVETSDKIFNINISKQQEEKSAGDIKENPDKDNLYKIKFTVINENSLLSTQGNGALVVNNNQNKNQLSFLPFDSELIEENVKNIPTINLKVFTYKNTGSENILLTPSTEKLSSAAVQSQDTESKTNAVQNSPVQVQGNAEGEKIVETSAVNNAVKVLSVQSEIKNETKAESADVKLQGKVPADNNAKVIESKPIINKADNVNGAQQNELKDSKIINPLKSYEIVNTDDVKTIQQTELKDSKIINSGKSNEIVNTDENNGKKVKIENNENTPSKQLKTESVIVKNEGAAQDKGKETADPFTKSGLKIAAESDTDVKKDMANKSAEVKSDKQPVKKIDDDIPRENQKTVEKPVKENEQLNLKVAKAVKNITTIKPETAANQVTDKPVKEHSEVKINSTEEKANVAQQLDTNEKNNSNSQNSFKQSDENRHITIDSNRISTNDIKEKFTLEAPTPHSNAERIVKVAEMMKEISRFIEKQENSTLTIKISPEELGKVKITMDISEQSVKANIHVENEAVKAIVEKNIADLQNQMSKNGIQLSSVNVMLSDNEQKTAKQFVNKKKSTSLEMNENNLEEIEEEKVKMMGYNTVEYLA